MGSSRSVGSAAAVSARHALDFNADEFASFDTILGSFWISENENDGEKKRNLDCEI